MSFQTFRIKDCLPEVLEQPESGTPTFYAMAIHDICHINACKQRTLLSDVNISAAFVLT